MTSRFSRWIAFALVCCLALSAAPTAWALDAWVCPYDQSKNTGSSAPTAAQRVLRMAFRTVLPATPP